MPNTVRINEEFLQRMAQAIVDEVDPEQIILFGSHAGAARGRIRTWT